MARSDPTRSGTLARELEERFPGALAFDLGGLLLVLRAAVADLSFLWWATAVFSLLVSLALHFTPSSIAQICRGSELALFRALGASRRQLLTGPLAEAVIQAVVCGLVGGGLAQHLILRAARLFSGSRVPFDRAILADGGSGPRPGPGDPAMVPPPRRGSPGHAGAAQRVRWSLTRR